MKTLVYNSNAYISDLQNSLFIKSKLEACYLKECDLTDVYVRLDCECNNATINQDFFTLQ